MEENEVGAGKSVLRAIGSVFKVLGIILGTLLLVGLLTGGILALRFGVYVREELSEQTGIDLENFTLDQTSVLYYKDPESGRTRELLRLYGAENRTVVSYDKLPRDLINACVAIEDKRFYDHQGVDWLRTIKASLNMFLGGEDQFGASTLTQQLIKNLTGRDEVTVRRKLTEIFSALEFEKSHSKREILTWYLNTIYLGEGCYGVQSASRVYFGKDVEDLTTAECASLIGITKNPSVYDPYLNEENNLSRQKDILWAMYDQGYIPTRAAYEEAKAQKLVFQNTSGEDDDESEYYSYFVDQVLRDVTDALVGEGYTRQLAEQMVRSGGLVIYTTFNPDVQAKVDAIYEDLANIPDTESSQQLQSGIAVIDNKTGDLVAVAGGVGRKPGSLTFNRATQSYLQPGSTIKPLSVYTPALELGLITPASVFDDTPFRYGEKDRWPKNSDNAYHGLMSVDQAVQQSTNTIAVKVLEKLGVETAFRFARERLGLRTLVDRETVNGRVLSDTDDYGQLALGGLARGVTVDAMAAGYAALANEGVYREPRTYTEVYRRTGGTEEIILDNTQSKVEAVSARAAWYMTYMLENTVKSGTGARAQLENMAVAGKTGTTNDDKDRWFCGYTPCYTAAVWCGYDLPEEVILTDPAIENPAVYLWQRVMAGIHEGMEYQSFPRPSNVVECSYCRDSGLLATEACRADPRGDRTVRGYLTLEDAPRDYCTTHKYVEICDASGQLANEFCGQVEGNTTHRAGLLDIERMLPQSGIVVGDQQYVIERPRHSGYYNPVSPTGERMGELCPLHSESDLIEEEPEEEPEEEAPEEEPGEGEPVDTDFLDQPEAPPPDANEAEPPAPPEDSGAPETPSTPETPEPPAPSDPSGLPETPESSEPPAEPEQTAPPSLSGEEGSVLPPNPFEQPEAAGEHELTE